MMKKIIPILCLTLSLTVLFSCKPLKEGYGIEAPEQYSRIYLAAAYNGIQEMTLESTQPASVKIFANYSGVLPLATDLSVTLQADLSLVNAYNIDHGTAFQPIPTACFAFENSVSVIEAGKSTAAQPAVLKFLTDAFVDSTPYLLPVSIVSLSDSALAVNDNLKTLYFSVSCVAGTLYISSNPLTDYTFSNTENW